MEQMAEAIDAVEQTSYSSIAKVPEREHYPVSSAQKRLLILNELVGAGTAYNMPFVLQLTGSWTVHGCTRHLLSSFAGMKRSGPRFGL